jgi:prepilin-type N-terminal cleavage/methylation domain-containing protein/prepilin-type processing-associated H-X9-DG protein
MRKLKGYAIMKIIINRLFMVGNRKKTMRKTAFTLIELLVVVGIIAVLLALLSLMPASNRARELAQRAVCANRLKAILTANECYADKYEGRYTPITVWDTGGTISTIAYWWTNNVFRACIDMDSYTVGGGSLVAPKAFQCPTDKIAKDPANATAGVLVSYGYNYTDFFSGTWTRLVIPPAYPGKAMIDKLGNSHKYTVVAGHRADSVYQPAEKMAFVDSIDWWVCWYSGWSWSSADYRRGWDRLGQANIAAYKAAGLNGPVIYRHDEGANVGFYDGHVGYLKKQQIYIDADWKASPKRPGMWTAIR